MVGGVPVLKNYYQILRINEAAHLIKNEGVSVSEAGYRLGFINLSHFTRLFEKHKGCKPKKYSNTKFLEAKLSADIE
nr:helix-turn-helix domain-containing protein [Pedobacter panaciterrae]